MKRNTIKKVILFCLTAIVLILTLAVNVFAEDTFFAPANQSVYINTDANIMWSWTGINLYDDWNDGMSKSGVISCTNPPNDNWSVRDLRYNAIVCRCPLMMRVNSADPFFITKSIWDEYAQFAKVYAVVYCTDFTANNTLTAFLTYNGATDVNTLTNVEIIPDGNFHVAYFDFRAWYNPSSYDEMVSQGIRNGIRIDMPEYTYDCQTVEYGFNVLMITAHDSLQDAWITWNYKDASYVGGTNGDGGNISDDVIQNAVQEGYNNGYADGNTDGYNQGYQAGIDDSSDDIEDAYNNGYEYGYNYGENIGFLNGYESGQNSGYNQGYDEGKTAGYNNGYDEGYSNGVSIGYNNGYRGGYEAGLNDSKDDIDSAYNDGFNNGYTDGYNDGVANSGASDYQQGYKDGFEIGISQSANDSYNIGYEAGKNEGQVNGYNNGYRDGLAEHENDFSAGYYEGYDQGKQSGYIEGFNEGSSDNNFWLDLFNGIANVPINIITSLFNFEIFGINLLSIFLGIVTILVFIWVVKKVV